jgi:hypothetical protein
MRGWVKHESGAHGEVGMVNIFIKDEISLQLSLGYYNMLRDLCFH